MDRRSFLQVLSLSIATVACSAPAPTAAPAAPTAAPVAKPTTSAAPQPTSAPAANPTSPPAEKAPSPPPAKPAAPATQPPAKAKIERVRIAQSAPTMSFAPLYIAQGLKLFEAESLDVEVQQVAGGALSTTAVLNGESDFMAGGADTTILANDKGLGFVVVAALSKTLTQSFVAGAAFMRQRGVTPQSPLQQRVNAIKGGKIGVNTFTGQPTIAAKYAMKFFGLNPDADAEFVVAGQGAAPLVALKQGLVDMIITGEPNLSTAEQDGSGAVLIDLADEVPFSKAYVQLASSGRREWVEQHADVTERSNRALIRACQVLAEDPSRAKDALKSAFGNIDAAVVDKALDRVRPTWNTNGRITEEMMKNSIELLVFAEQVKQATQSAEGVQWTNKYLVNTPRQ